MSSYQYSYFNVTCCTKRLKLKNHKTFVKTCLDCWSKYADSLCEKKYRTKLLRPRVGSNHQPFG